MSKPISKLFCLRLSEKGKEVKYVERDQLGRSVEVKMDLREVEIAMLINLFDVSAGSQDSFKGTRECLKCIKQLEGLVDTDLDITLSEGDITHLQAAWKKTSGSGMVRPMAWNKCYDLIEQLSDPASADKKEEKKEEAPADVPAA